MLYYPELKKKINTSSKDILNIIPFDPPATYSLEIKTRIISSTGRGLDIDARGKSGKGFRFSLDKNSIKNSGSLTSIEEITPIDNTVEQVYRFAVKDDQVYIYSNLEYLGSRNTGFIKDILANDLESESSGTYGNNITDNWAGPSGTGTGMPTAYGWDATGGTIPWNSANGTSGVRYLDLSSASSPNHLLNGNVFTGRLLTLRWDGSLGSSVYYYPVTLAANTTYELSFIYEHWNNGTLGAPITAGVSQTKTQTGIYSSSTFITIDKNKLQQGIFKFSSKEAGQYYITFTGASGTMYGVGNMILRSLSFENRLLTGKNDNQGNLDAEIYSISYQEGAYAPSSGIVTGPALPEKDILVTEISGNQNINAPTGSKQIQTIALNPKGNYTIEIATTIESNDGRGLDFELRDGIGTGFRTSLASESFRWAAPFTSIRQISRSDNSKQIIRYAVQGNQVHIYKNKKFAESFNLTQIGDMNENGSSEISVPFIKPTNLYDGLNLISNPDFKNDAHNAAPIGWISDKSLGTSPNPRVQEKSQTTELSAYPDGKKAFMFRFDSNGGTYYAYQVTLKTNQWHELSFDLITWGTNPGVEYDVVIATTADGTSGIIKNQRVKTPAVRATAERQMIRFHTSTLAAVTDLPFYIVFRKVATVGTMAVTDIYLREGGINKLLVGKNYTEGSLNCIIDYIRYDNSGAYAPAQLTSDVPNPEKTKFNIINTNRKVVINNLPSPARIEIYNLQGILIESTNITGDSYITSLINGFYLIRVNDVTEKFIVRN